MEYIFSLKKVISLYKLLYYYLIYILPLFSIWLQEITILNTDKTSGILLYKKLV